MRRQSKAVLQEILDHRALYNTLLALVITACLIYLLWEPLTERILAWMRWHFWGYPA
jgi:hypothetical protein